MKKAKSGNSAKILTAAIFVLMLISLISVFQAGTASASDGITLTVTSDGDWDNLPLSKMDQHFSTDTIDASTENTTLSGSVALGNFENGSGNDVWYEIGLVSDATYLGYSRLHNKGVYMIALWTGSYYKVHMQNVPGTTPTAQQTGNYLGNGENYVDLWGDNGLCYFKVPSANFQYEIKYHDVTADNGKFDLRINENGTWSGWKLYKYAENDAATYWDNSATAAEYGYAGDDHLTNARIVSQIFVCSATTETFTATYDNIKINDVAYELSPRVVNTTTSKGYAGIQVAIDNASPGGTIEVAAGTYNEQVVINKQLTLRGANADVNAVTGTRGSESIIDGGTSTAVTTSAGDVIVNGFTLDGGITLDDKTNTIRGGTISNNIITGADNPEEPTKAQNGIRVGWDTGLGVDGVTIENNTISNSLEKGIRFANTEEHKGGPPQHISNITISGNKIENNGSAGMETYGPGPNTIINNIISGNDGNGINLKFDNGDIVTGNIITNNTGPGITLRQVTNTTVENNSVSGHLSEEVIKTCPAVDGGKGSGIHIFDTSVGNTIRFNDISGNNYGIFIHSKGDLQPSGNSIEFNNISGNNYYGILNALSDPPTPVDATYNWWGSENGPSTSLNTFNVGQQGDNVSGNVDFTPWLDAAYPGGEPFAPVVNENTGDNFSSIQAAVDAASPGDTVLVYPGTYEEAVKIDKSLTLLGAKAGVDARTRDTSSGESILDGANLAPGLGVVGFTIADGVSDVIIDGFEICNYPTHTNPGDGSAVAAFSYGTDNLGLSRITIQNNYMHDLGWNGVLVWSNNEVIQTDFTIQFNLIGEAPYAGIELTNVINSGVLNNEIIAPTTIVNDPGDAGVGIEIAVRAYAGISMTAGTNVLVEGNEITGAFADGSRAGINLLSRSYAGSINATLSGVVVGGNTVSGGTNVRAGILVVAERRGDGPAQITNLMVENNILEGNKVGLEVEDKDGGTHSLVTSISGNMFENNAVQVRDNSRVLDILNVVTNNTFDRAVIVETASYLPFIWSSIQNAIDDANPGDTVLVYPGTYEEYILIDKPLTVKSTNGAEETIIDGISFRYMIRIYSEDVTFEGFTVTNPTYEGGADASGILIGAYLENSVDNVNILNNIVKAVRSGTTGAPSMYGATGINIGRGQLSNVVVSGNTIENIHNPDGAPVDHTCGINVWDGAENVVISNNTISDIKYNGIILECARNVRIKNNAITECGVGIRVEPYEGATVSDLTIHYNNIAGNEEYGVLNTTKDKIDATYNWWGHPSGPRRDKGNPNCKAGRGDRVSENVLYHPWLSKPFQTVLEKHVGHYGFEGRYLEKGWNTLSVPIYLDNNAWEEIAACLDENIAYRFNASTQAWELMTTGSKLDPLDAIYIRMNSENIVPLVVSVSIRSPPVKELKRGWNLIGLAVWEEENMLVDQALVSVELTPDGNRGYTIVVSPPLNRESWTVYTIGQPGEKPLMNKNKGYWVYMENPGNLAGFSNTPLPFWEPE